MRTTCMTCWWRTKAAPCSPPNWRTSRNSAGQISQPALLSHGAANAWGCISAAPAHRRRVAGRKGLVASASSSRSSMCCLVGSSGCRRIYATAYEHTGLTVQPPICAALTAARISSAAMPRPPMAGGHTRVRDAHDLIGERVVEHREMVIHHGCELMRDAVVVNDAHALLDAPEDAPRGAAWARAAVRVRLGASADSAPAGDVAQLPVAAPGAGS